MSLYKIVTLEQKWELEDKEEMEVKEGVLDLLQESLNNKQPNKLTNKK